MISYLDEEIMVSPFLLVLFVAYQTRNTPISGKCTNRFINAKTEPQSLVLQKYYCTSSVSVCLSGFDKSQSLRK